MPTVFGDRLYVGGQVFTIDCHPLDPCLASLPRRPCGRLARQPAPYWVPATQLSR
jgi:hypothetical protein